MRKAFRPFLGDSQWKVALLYNSMIATVMCQQIFQLQQGNAKRLIIVFIKMSSASERNEPSISLSSEREDEGSKKGSSYIPGEKSGRWSDEEHMKYIIFIDFNKEKMRSKEKRRSNKFYEEMSHFISTRNSLQCRSHHQKLEEKYTHVNRIIALFKPHFNKVLYKKFMDQLETMTHEKHLDSLTKYTISDRVMVDQEIQTDIQDIRCDLVEVNPNLVIVHNKKSLGMPGTLSYQHSQQYYPPPIYSPMEAQYQPGPSYPIGHLGWWGGYPARRY